MDDLIAARKWSKKVDKHYAKEDPDVWITDAYGPNEFLKVAFAEVDRLTTLAESWEDTATTRKIELQNADGTLTTIRFALRPESETVNGWRPGRGIDPLVDLALDVRERAEKAEAERDELREALAASEARNTELMDYLK